MNSESRAATPDVGRHVVYKLLYVHIVLAPKYRRKMMAKRVVNRLRESFDKVCSHPLQKGIAAATAVRSGTWTLTC